MNGIVLLAETGKQVGNSGESRLWAIVVTVVGGLIVLAVQHSLQRRPVRINQDAKDILAFLSQQARIGRLMIMPAFGLPRWIRIDNRIFGTGDEPSSRRLILAVAHLERAKYITYIKDNELGSIYEVTPEGRIAGSKLDGVRRLEMSRLEGFDKAKMLGYSHFACVLVETLATSKAAEPIIEYDQSQPPLTIVKVGGVEHLRTTDALVALSCLEALRELTINGVLELEGHGKYVLSSMGAELFMNSKLPPRSDPESRSRAGRVAFSLGYGMGAIRKILDN